MPQPAQSVYRLQHGHGRKRQPFLVRTRSGADRLATSAPGKKGARHGNCCTGEGAHLAAPVSFSLAATPFTNQLYFLEQPHFVRGRIPACALAAQLFMVLPCAFSDRAGFCFTPHHCPAHTGSAISALRHIGLSIFCNRRDRNSGRFFL